MKGRVTHAVYEEPSRWSRVVVIACAVVAILLTFLIALPPLLSLVGHKGVTPHLQEIVSVPSSDPTIAAASSDQLSQTTTAKPIPSIGNALPAAESSVVPTVEMSRTVVSSTADAPPLAAQDPPAPAPATNGSLSEKPPPWTPIELTPAQASVLEIEAEPVAKPPLPRARPHQLTLAGIVGIPLPPPRPFIPTDAAGTDREVSRGRFDPF